MRPPVKNSPLPQVPKKLVPLEHSALTSVAEELPNDPKLLAHLAKGLKRALQRHSSGVGLALPQLGISLRGFYMRDTQSQPARSRFCFNPIILSTGDSTYDMAEGCLSIESGSAQFTVTRPKIIDVRYLNERGQVVEEQLRGFGARIFQHERDHLDGILISSKGTPVEKPTYGHTA